MSTEVTGAGAEGRSRRDGAAEDIRHDGLWSLDTDLRICLLRILVIVRIYRYQSEEWRVTEKSEITGCLYPN